MLRIRDELATLHNSVLFGENKRWKSFVDSGWECCAGGCGVEEDGDRGGEVKFEVNIWGPCSEMSLLLNLTTMVDTSVQTWFSWFCSVFRLISYSRQNDLNCSFHVVQQFHVYSIRPYARIVGLFPCLN